MTSSTAINSPFHRRGGFTLVEMLVVIGVIMVLIGILMPALNLAYSHSVRNRMQMDIQTISIALEQYKADQRGYPQLDYNDTGATGIMKANCPGAVLLCSAVASPAFVDKTLTQHGPGYQVVPKGQVYGPYIGTDRVKLAIDPGMAPAEPQPPSPVAPTGTQSRYYIADRYGHPILYFLANFAADSSKPNGFAASVNGATPPTPRYNLFDNSSSSTNPFFWPTDPNPTTNALIRFQLMLGDRNTNGQLDPGESPATNAAYLLWSAGPDELFGIDLSRGTTGPALATAASYVPNCDDATNFHQ